MLQRVNDRPRRILMTVDAVGGVWQYALGLSEHLVESGCFVLLAGLGPAPTSEQKKQAERIAPLEWLLSPPEWMASAEKELDPLHSELSCLAEKNAIDLVQVNEPAQAAGLKLRCPVVAVAHSCIATWFRAVRNSQPPTDWAWHQERTRAGMYRADVVVAPSASHAAALAACYGPLPRLLVAHNAVSTFSVTEQRHKLIFAAGRWWDEGKNGIVLDRAARKTSWPIVTAGATTGPNSATAAFANVTSLGALPNAQIRRLAARCGIFVSPSLYEPFGLAALEAATAGTPLVLSDIPTYRELWSGAALFFPPREPDALASTLNHLAGNGGLRRELGDMALRRSRTYTLQRQAAAMGAAYEQASMIHVGRA